MKTKYLIISTVLCTLCCLMEVHAQSADRNYILKRSMRNDAGTQYNEVIQYFDGLGRLSQTVQRAVTPTSKDLVSLQEYDGFGHESYTWLPAAIASNAGKYVDPVTLKAAAKTSNANDQSPFVRTVYEPSPLNRVLEKYGPGQDWHSNKKAVKSLHLSVANNDTLNGIYYTVSKTGDLAYTINKRNNYSSYTREQFTVYVSWTADENGNTSIEFKNRKGQVLLIRNIQRNGSIKVFFETYFIYDDFDNLAVVLPPLAADAMKTGTSWASTSDIIKKYAYLYTYDEKQRCIAKKLPGCEPVYYIYDKADRLVATQDGEQRSRGVWVFTVPDVFGRIVLTGTFKNSLAYASDPFKNMVIKADRTNNTNNYKGYSIPSGISLSSPALLSVNYYDDYAFLGYNGMPNSADTQYTTESGYGVCYGDHQPVNANKNKGLLTGTLTTQQQPDGTLPTLSLYSVSYYDYRGRLVQYKANNHLAGGLEKEFYSYNLAGQVLARKHIHQATGKTTQTEVYSNTYDHAGRLTKATHQLNGGSIITLAQNTYDDLGRLASNQKHTHANLKTTYTYNVRSWPKVISGPLFRQTLYYSETYGGSEKQYNGNISGMSWNVSGDSFTRGYAFRYDDLSKLIGASYLVNGVANNNYKTLYSHDKHGNITTIQRYGQTTASAYGLIDNLQMTYSGNQLLKVEDAVGTISLAESADFKNYSNQATEYTYNGSGSLTKDLNKGISQIQYNLLNLPRLVDIKSPVAEARNEYTYSGDGRKLKVVQKWNSSYSTSPVVGSAINTAALNMTKTTDYVGNMIYENNTLKRILVDGGYIESGVYYFYLTDHQGNNRVVANAGGVVIQKTHYYPFGAAFAENTGRDKQPYKYNGKELDEVHGLNLYDYGARHMEPALGRFTSVDPLAEKYYAVSPYAYCANNPVKYTDPTGMWIKGTDGKPVIFSKEIGWSQNASTDVKRVGNAMMMTETGTTHLTKMLFDNEAIAINITNDVVNKNGGYSLGNNKRTGQKLQPDGSIDVGEHQITINTGSIEKVIGQDAGENPYKGLTMDQAIGAIAGHESGHTEKENTKQSYENNSKGANHDLEAHPNEIENKILEELKKK